MSVLDKVRRWIDGESAELVLEEAARDAQIKPRSHAEEFIVKIARAVEEVMQNEMVPLPQGDVLIPTEYIIFLSAADDKDWQGLKRRGLEQGLLHILSERAREIAGKKRLKTKSFALELRVDGTLDKDEIVVQHGWDDSKQEKTGVGVRRDEIHETESVPTPVPNPSGSYNIPPPNFAAPSAQDASPIPAPITNELDEMTKVAPRGNAPLYQLEIWRDNVRQNLIPVYKQEIVIGRGSKSRPVDITLSGDPEISRRHAVLLMDKFGGYALINEGRNPAILNNAELPLGQRITIRPGQSVFIGSYALRIQAS
ncbi:MAG: FHA domain-containing protein [Pyrinomonadaceae bacterium]